MVSCPDGGPSTTSKEQPPAERHSHPSTTKRLMNRRRAYLTHLAERISPS